MIRVPSYLRYLYQVYYKPPSRYGQILTIIRRGRCRSILEIGVYNGSRALQMINAAAISHSRCAIRYVGFDLFEDITEELLKKEWSKKPRTEAQIRQLLARTRANVELYRGFSQETLPRFIEREAVGGRPIDFVFIDGGHTIETIRTDWQNIQRLMTQETIVVFDDFYTNPPDELSGIGCQAVIQALDPLRYQVNILPLEDHFQNQWGTLRIRLALVRRCEPASGALLNHAH